jgi:hypothetical protein
LEGLENTGNAPIFHKYTCYLVSSFVSFSLALSGGVYYIGNVFNNDIEFNRSAFKHGISEADIRHAMDHWIYEDQIDMGGYEDTHLLLGFDTSRRLLEILYNVIDDRTINVFHAMECRNVWRSLAGL